MSIINIAQYNPIIEIRDNVVFANNGNIIACYRVGLPEIHSLSEKDFEDMHSTWFQAFKSLPIGSVIHKQDVYLKKAFTSEYLPNDTFLAKATYEHFKGREYMHHKSYLFFTLAHNKTLNNPKYVNPFRKINKGIHKELDQKVNRFLASVSDSVTYINNGRKVSLKPLEKEVILQLSHNLFNGFEIGCDTDMVLGPSRRSGKSNVTIGNDHFDVLAVNSENCFGDRVKTSKVNERFTSDDFVFHQGFIDGLGLTLNENHIVNQIIYLDDKQKWRRALDKKIEELKKSSKFGTQNKVILKKVEQIVEKINNDDSASIIRGHLNIVHWGRDAQHLEQISSQIKSEFKELDVTPYYPRAEERKNYLLNSHPCFASNFSNSDVYVTDLKHALCLYLNNTNYRTDKRGIIFNDREHNIPVLKDVWDDDKKRIKARNFAIFAPTGEGKSFLANNILRQYFEAGVRLVIIDLGGSYTKFASLYPEQFTVLRYESGKNLGINPFYVSGNREMTADRIEDLTVFLLELYGEGATGANKAKQVALKKILVTYYREVQLGHSLQGFFDFISHKKDVLLQELAIPQGVIDLDNFLLILSEYVDDGIYSFLFERHEDRSHKIEDKRLIVFELDEVKDNREILSVMLKLIKTAIQRTIWQNKEEKGIILFDEFAKQLKFDNVLESVEFYYQAIRKQNGAIGIILQSINQLPDTTTSASILENTQIIYSLNNEKGYDQLKNRLSLSSHDLNQLKSIKNNLSGKRKYTEFFLKIGKESNIFRLEVPKEVYAAYLTDGPENDRIMRIYKNKGCMETAIKTFINQKP